MINGKKGVQLITLFNNTFYCNLQLVAIKTGDNFPLNRIYPVQYTGTRMYEHACT